MKEYWLCYSGINLAGSFASDNEPSICVGIKEDADLYAYEESIGEVESYEGLHGIPHFTDDEEEIEKEDYEHYDEMENYVDYYVEPINQKALDNFPHLWSNLQRWVESSKDDFEEVCKKYSIRKPE